MAYTYSKIASVIVGSGGASSINFIAIPQNYTDLVIKFCSRDANAGHWSNVLTRFNGSESGYATKIFANADGAVATTTASDALKIVYSYSTATSATASVFSSNSMYINNYSNSTISKSVSIETVAENVGTQVIVGTAAGSWSSLEAVNSISLAPSGSPFSQNSSFDLYGIRAEV